MKINLPIVADMHINQFSGAVITELESGMTNGVFIADGKGGYVTQRPSFDMFEDASTHVSDARGRAITYWDGNTSLYILNNGTLFKNSQSNPISTLPTSGTKKCKFVVLDTLLCLFDAENGQGFTITTGDVVTEITDVDFPPKQTPSVGLAFGAVVLDGYVFVLGENGVIYNSNLEVASAWAALDFLNAEREPDGGAYIGKHHDHVVVLGVRTTEFFYNQANQAGSPLGRRQDVAYSTGCSAGESVWEIGDRMFFVGTNESGALGVYTLENFQIRKVSTSTIDSFLTQATVKEGYELMGSGLSAQGHVFYTLTLHSTPGNILPEITLVFDDVSRLWGEWKTVLGGHSTLPLVDWTVRRGIISRYGEGVLSNGDLVTINDDLTPNDSLLEFSLVEDGIVEIGILESNTGSGSPLTMKIRLGHFDGNTDNKKFLSELRPVCNKTVAPQNLIVRWASENNNSFSAGRVIDMSKFNRIKRIGCFRRRNHEIEYSGAEVIRLRRLEGQLSLGSS